MKEDLKERSDYEYFEEFEEYEFTTCITYEMYIRSKVYSSNSIDIKEINFNYTLSDIFIYKYNNITYTLQNFIYSIYPQLLDVAKENIKKYYSNNNKVDLTKHLHNYSLDLEFVIKEYINNDQENFNIITYFDPNANMYIKLTKDLLIDKIKKSYTNKYINLKFKCPILDYARCNDFSFININLSLPDNELLDYIKKLRLKKLEVKPNTSILKILENKDSKKINKDNIYKFEKEIEKGQNKNKIIEINAENILTFNGKKRKKNCADMFFIYDSYKKQKTKEDIQNELEDFHNIKVYDPKEIKKLHDIAKKYIDELKFYEIYHSFYP